MHGHVVWSLRGGVGAGYSATCNLSPTANSRYKTYGRIEFFEVSDGLSVTLSVVGLSNGNHSYHGTSRREGGRELCHLCAWG